MAEVVFAVGGIGDLVPGEVGAAAGAGFANRVEEIHGGNVFPAAR